MADIDYEYAHGIACAELAKAKAEIGRLRREFDLMQTVARELHDEVERLQGELCIALEHPRKIQGGHQGQALRGPPVNPPSGGSSACPQKDGYEKAKDLNHE